MSNKLYKSFLSVTSISILTRLISFAFHVYLSRLFGALNIGIFSISSSVFFMFSCFASSGFPTTLSRKIAYYDALNDNEHSDSILSSTLIITTLISSAICIFFALVPSSLNLLFSNKKCHSVFLILLPTLISTAIYATFRAWFWGKKKYTIYSLLELADEIFLLFGVLIISSINVYKDTPYNAFALANGVGDIFCIITIIIIFIIFGGKIKKPSYASEITLASLPITTTRIIASLMSSIIALLLPSLLLKSGISLDMATADYGRMNSMAMPIILAPNTIISSLIIVLIPELSSLIAQKGNQSANKKIYSAIIFSALISGFFMSIFICCGKDIAVLFYADEKAGDMLSISSIIILPLVISQLTTSMLNTLGKENSTFLTSLVASFGLVITLVIFAKPFGIYAYPLALLIYHLINLSINTYKLKSTTNISLKYLASTTFILVISLAIGYLTKYIQNSYCNFNLLLKIVLSTLLIILMFSLAFFALIKHHKKQVK